MAAGGSETEIKIRIKGPDEVLQSLQALGFRESKPRVFETNAIYDNSGGDLRSRGCLLRLRQVADISILTFKGPSDRGKHKSREELETSVGSGETLKGILQRLQFAQVFRYDKYRTEFEKSCQQGIVTLDETPIGWYIELEGNPEWIDRTAEELGFCEADYITASYGTLYLQYCADNAVNPGDMVFVSST